MTRLVGPGSPEPLGVVPLDAADGMMAASIVTDGINVAVHAPHAEAIDLCLFDAHGETEIDWVRLPARTGDVHHGAISGVGVGDRYALRAHGPWAPGDGHRFNPAKLLMDPFALAIDRPFRLDSAQFDTRATGALRDDVDSAFSMPKAIVTAPVFAPPRRPLHAWADLVIYELHVKGFTRLHPEIPPEIQGTFAGLAHPAAIRHLTDLGVTAVELMPSAAWIDELHLDRLGLSNYWGYNPITNLAPDPRLAPGGWDEVRFAVDTLHQAGIAVILDVVLNHTGEGDHLGPTLSMRGLDNAAWYRLDPANRSLYANDAGCGNVLAADRPVVVRLIMETLRTWAARAGLDGFRFDLAPVLARTAQGFDPQHAVLSAIGQDPMLKDLILIAEPWDIGWGGYQLGQFPALWGEWNDRYRDTARRFWKGDAGLIGAFTTSFAGSADVFAFRRRALSRSVNFITAHDGFSLADLVAYQGKHNEANGESNRDGTDANQSWNYGVEGPTTDPAILAARARDIRALLATLILSRGTPMLSMGDELGRSQGGNNNAYSQDNPLSWIDWPRGDGVLAGFVARLIALRRSSPALHGEAPLTGRAPAPGLAPDVEWLTAAGQPMTPADWNDPACRLLIAVFGPGDAAGGRVIVALNASHADVALHLPEPGIQRLWHSVVDSADPARSETLDWSGSTVLPARSVKVIVEIETAVPQAERAAKPVVADGVQLDRLASAAGIAAEWWDISGRYTRVSAPTKRAILSGMGLHAGSAAEMRDSLALLSERQHGRMLPQTVVAREGQPIELLIGGDLARSSHPVSMVLRREGGLVEELATITPRNGLEVEVTAVDGTTRRLRRITLPPQPAGRHRLLIGDGLDAATDLIVAPARCYLVPGLGEHARRFGVAAHLYTVRRNGDQGIGDFTTLLRLGELAGGHGAATLGINPLHMMYPGERERASPYHPSDRRFLDPIYIDVANLPAPLRGEALRTALWSEMRSASALSSVDYTRVWQLKKKVLDIAFAGFERMLSASGETALVRDFDAFVDRGGERLQRFATFQAIAEQIGHSDWREWPGDVAERIRADTLQTAIRYHSFLQWLADRQLAEAAAKARAAGLSLGFYRDLAVGCAPDGAESWVERDHWMRGLSIGAPPDPFSVTGQVWHLPPPNPHTMQLNGYAGFSALIASNMAHAGALRIDHAMGLRRMFVVPDGADGADGAYVDMPFDDLLGVLALESHRARCLVVGEDLGTVPEGFREALTEANVLSYKVLWFEREGSGFIPPRHWPAQSAACVSTHDLPTLAGWWSGADIAEHLTLGMVDGDGAVRLSQARADEQARLCDLLLAEGLINERPDPALPLPEAVIAAIHTLVGASPSWLALAQADDFAGETKAVNLPGTDRERPNWRRKLAPDVERLFSGTLAQRILAAIATGR